MWHLFKSRCSVIWREEVKNRTGSTEPQNVSYQCLRGCNRGKYAFICDSIESVHEVWGKISTVPWTRTAWDHAEAHFVPKIGGCGGFAPTDGVQWLQHVRGGSGRQHELWSVGIPSLINHHHRSSAVALTFNRLTDRRRVRGTASPTQSYGEGASEQTDIYGRWQFANISICAKALGVTMRIAMKLEESAASIYFIRPFPPPWGAIAWQREVSECVKTPTKTHSAWIRDSNKKVFSKRLKKKLISFNKTDLNTPLSLTGGHHTYLHPSKMCIYLQRNCDADDNQDINQDIDVTKVWVRCNIIGE